MKRTMMLALLLVFETVLVIMAAEEQLIPLRIYKNETWLKENMEEEVSHSDLGVTTRVTTYYRVTRDGPVDENKPVYFHIAINEHNLDTVKAYGVLDRHLTNNAFRQQCDLFKFNLSTTNNYIVLGAKIPVVLSRAVLCIPSNISEYVVCVDQTRYNNQRVSFRPRDIFDHIKRGTEGKRVPDGVVEKIKNNKITDKEFYELFDKRVD